MEGSGRGLPTFFCRDGKPQSDRPCFGPGANQASNEYKSIAIPPH
jgi:hypothetical protein